MNLGSFDGNPFKAPPFTITRVGKNRNFPTDKVFA